MSWLLVFRILFGLKCGFEFITFNFRGKDGIDFIIYIVYMLVCSLFAWWGLSPILDLI